MTPPLRVCARKGLAPSLRRSVVRSGTTLRVAPRTKPFLVQTRPRSALQQPARPAPAGRPARGRSRNGPLMIWLRRLGWTAAAVLLLMVVAWLGLPALLMWQLPPRLSEALGRPVKIGKIELTPWTLEV